ncbi:hypothetical protein HYZ97_01885 [Candidatus Pacearchaeota archaeon]|nr:hypothetical protein [Candidatus Pacearchaeota archaeon]
MTATVAIIHGEALTDTSSPWPFRAPNLTVPYANFSLLGKAHGIDLLLTAAPLVNRETLETKGWLFNGDSWTIEQRAPVLFYDRFRYENASAEETSLRGHLNEKNQIVNSLALEQLCKDKYLTARTFPEYLIPTFLVEGECSHEQAVTALQKRAHSDLTCEHLVRKNRYGSGGEGISINKPQGIFISRDASTLIQPYLETAAGIPELGITRRHDLRIVVVNGKLIVAEARIMYEETTGQEMFFPKSHTSDTQVIPIESISDYVLDRVRTIDDTLAHHLFRVYSVDFGRGASRKPWVFELNSRPQQTWQPQNQYSAGDTPELIACRKKQQEAIVTALAERVNG